MNTFRIALFFLTAALGLGQSAAPIISGITPANASPGAQVTISGTNLVGSTAVTFGGVSATTFSYNSAAGTISATVPFTAKSGDVVVTTTDGGASAGFSYSIPLTITTQPAHLVVSAGQAQAFAVTVGGGAAGSTYSYVWKRGTTSVGANNRILYLPAISSADVGDYSVTVSDGASSVTSVSAALRLATPNVWTWRNPTTTGNDLWAVAYGAGRYVAVGRLGTILTSTDGATWTAQPQLVPATFTNVVFADSKFLALGSNGNLLVSSDGVSWTARNVGESVTLYGAARNATTWVITASGGAIYTSADAATWTRVPSANIGNGAFTSPLQGVIATSTGFMTVSVGGHVLVGNSAGNSWTITQPASGIPLYDVQQRTAGGVTTTIIVGASKTLRSTDGTNWTDVVTPPSPGTAVDWNRIIATDSGWVALGGNYASTYIGYVARSVDDGVTWSAVSSPALAVGPQFIGGTFAAGTVTAVGTVGRISRSTDGGATWQNIYTGGLTFPGDIFAAATGTAGTLVAGQVGQVYFSANHESAWARANLGQDSAVIPGTTRIYGAAQGAGSYVLVGGNDNATAGAGKSYIFSSNFSGGASSSTWSRVDIDGPHFLAAATYDSVSGRFVTAGAGNKIYYAKNPALSSGADGWTAVDKPGGSTAAVRAATSAGGRFVLTGDNGAVFTSSDGIAWTVASAGVSVSLEAVAGNGAGTFVAGGWDGASSILVRSTDNGATWSRVIVPFTGSIRGMTYADGRFRTVGGSSSMLISADGGATWTAETSQFAAVFRAIVRTPKGYVAGGSSGAIATLSQPTASPVISDRTLTAGANVPPFKPVVAAGGAGNLTYSVFPALPAGLSLNSATGEITGGLSEAAAMPLFAGSDNFAADNLSTKWPVSYRTLGDGTANGMLSVNTTAGRLDFSKGAGVGSLFRRWDGDPLVANSTRTTASFATSWQADVTVTNNAAVIGSEYSSVGLQAASDGGWAAMMVTRFSNRIEVRGESSSIDFASFPVATIASGEGVRLRFSWDAATRTLKGAYSTNGGVSYTDLLTLASTTWVGNSSRGFVHEVFAQSTIAAAVAAGSNYLDDFSVSAKSVAAGVYTLTVTDAVGVTASVPVTVRVLPADSVLWQQFTQSASEQAPGRTVHAVGGKVYVPWSVYDRNPDMVGGRLVGPLARLNESDGSLDTSFRIDRFVRAVNHVVPLPDGKLLAALRVGDVEAVGRLMADGTLDATFSPTFFARGVRFITLQSDGKVLVAATDNPSVNAPAGALATGAPAILRLNATGTQDTSFSVVLNDGAILFAPPVVDSTGRVYLAGVFSSVNGTARVNIARVSSAGVLDTSFADPATVAGFGSNQARAVLLQSDGNVVVLGDFRSDARGTFSNPMMAIRFTSAGAFDSTYARPLRSELGINTAVGFRLRHGVILSDNKIVAVSDRLVRLNADGTRDTSFISRAFGKEAFWVSRADDGRFFVADQISVAAADGTPVSLANNGIACFAADGAPDFSFQAGGWGRSAPATSGLPLSDGRVWVAGTFNRYGGSPVPGVAQFTPAGALSTTQVVSGRLMSNAMVVPAGSDKAFLLAVTAFNSLETYAESLTRIGADGAVDTSFSPALPAGYSLGSASVFESPGGKVILFQSSVSAQAILNGETGDGLLRLNSDGTRDANFNSTLSSFASVERNSSNAITMIRTGGFGVGDVLADGRVLAGGAGVDGSVKLVRLKADGSLDTAFSAASLGTVVASTGFTSAIKDPATSTTAQFPISYYDAGNLVSAVRQGPDGKVYVGGRLALSGAPRGLVRLSDTGAIDTTFTGTGLAYDEGTTSPAVVAMVFDDSGRLYVAGQFDTFNGNPVPGLFRLKSDGTFDFSWQPGIGIDLNAPRVTATLRISGGKLYAFGTVARLNDPTLRSWVAADIGSAPVIAAISPANAAPGTTVTISGSNLAGVTRVTFGGLGASFTYNSTAGTISATVPPGATSGPVEVTTAGGSSAGFNFTVPLVIAAQPASAVVRNGGAFTLQVRPSGGTPPYAFQWRKGLDVLTGASSPVYARTNVGSAETGAYNVVVTDAAGASITSSTAVVSLASASETFLSDTAFARPDFKQDSLAGRVTIDSQGRTYATWTNGNYLSGVGTQLRGAVIRLKPDGTLDDSFNIGSALVDAWPVVPLPDGKVLVGGIASNESMETGYALPRVFRFNADGSRDYTYNSPHFAASPRFMTLQPDGRLLVVASSSTTGNGGIPVMARLNPDGSPDGSFLQPVLSTSGSIFCPPVVDAAGKIYVGGIFSTINGVARPAVARLNPDGSVDTSWTPSGFTVAGNAQVRGLALQTQGGNAGKLLVAGGPLYITGSSVNRPVIRLNPSGEVDASFTLVTQADAGMGVRPRLLVSLPDDRFYVVGSTVTRFLANGAVDTGYARPAFSTEFFWMDATADGRVVVPPEDGATINGAPAPSLVRFTSAGAVDASFAPAVFNREIYPGRFAVLGDGKLLTWGGFDRVNGTSRPGIARFNLNGSLDTAFNVSGIANLKYVAFAEVGSDGKILAGTRIGSNLVGLTAGISRLNADGTVDGSFALDSQLAGRTDGLEFRLLPDNKIAVWSVTAQGVVSNNNFIGRLTATGVQDTSFTASGFDSFGAVYRATNGAITSITLGAARVLAHDADGRLIGRATTGSYPANATNLNYTLVRVNADGSRDMSFSAPVVSWPTSTSFPTVTDPQTNGGLAGQVVASVVSGAPFTGVQPVADGKYLVFGIFQSLGGQTARGLARLTSNGALDTTFSVGAGAELRYQPGRLAQVLGVSVASDGKLWVTGAFDTFGGYAAPGIVRLNSDGSVDTTFVTDIVYQSYLGSLAQVGFASNGTVYVSGTYARPGDKFPSAFQALVNSPLGGSPVITSVSPNPVVAGGSITIAGNNLPASGSVTARIGNVDLTNVVLTASPAGITATVPSTVSNGAQVLTVNLPGGVVGTFQVNVSGGVTPTLSVDGVVRAWEVDPTRVGAIVNGQVFNVWTKVTAGLGTNTNLNPPPAAPANWGRLLSSTGFTSIAGESGITFKFGDLFFNPATFVSGANGNNGGITVQEYVPSFTARTPVEFYDSTGAILAKGFMEKVVNRVVYSTGAATGEASLVLNATGPAAKSAAFLQEVLQLTRGTGRMSVLISSYVATVLNNSYFDYLSTGSIVAAPVSEAARFIASASSMAKVPASGSQVTFRIPPGVNRKVLVRAVVSALPALGVTSGLLADPQLTLKDSGGTTLLSNDDWGSAANAASIETVSASVGAVVMVAGSKDAAILAELAPGTYTVEVKGAVGGSGIVLVELHAPENLGVPAFTQVTLQGPAGGADGSQILGFVLGGGAASDVLVRSVGPALGAGGLEDPRLNLTSGQSQQIATNDNWDGLAATISAFTQAGASSFSSGSKDSSVLLRLAPGAYVASSSAPTGAASGAVRTEVFLLPGGTVDALIHTADLDRDGRIALLELTRVIELYNTRNGTTRTGCYAVATTTTTEDGFVADSARVSSAVATLQRHHSADSNRDGKISLTELTRVIELYNYRTNTTRTGQYRTQAGTEDGFAPGP